MWFQPTKSIDWSGTHVVSVYATGLNTRDNNVHEEMNLLTRWGRDKITTICISFPNAFLKRLKHPCNLRLTVQLITNQNLVQAMAWHIEDTKPLPESVVIQANSAYMSLSDWLSWLLHVLGKYFHATKNGTVWPHEGYPHPHSWKWAIPTPQVGSGRGTSWPCFVKSPIALSHVVSNKQQVIIKRSIN